MRGPVGIELAPDSCRIVELSETPAPRARVRRTAVADFAVAPLGGDAMAEQLARLRGRRADVVVWDIASDHRPAIVADGAYEHMRAEARASLQDIGVQTRAVLADITPSWPRMAGIRQRNVVLATAPANQVVAALRPLSAAGIRVGAVFTPAAALVSLARLRSATPTGAFEAYVAMEQRRAVAVLIRDGLLVATRVLPWGFVVDPEFGGPPQMRSREEVAATLAGDLATFVDTCRLHGAELTLVAICGAVPDLRSMSALLVERLDIEVEPLDSLFGIDPAPLEWRAAELSDKAAEFRLAWAAAADRRPSLDLYRASRRRVIRERVSRAALAGGVAAGVALGWLVQSRWEPIRLPQSATVSDAVGARVSAAATATNAPGLTATEPPGARSSSAIASPIVTPPIAAVREPRLAPPRPPTDAAPPRPSSGVAPSRTSTDAALPRPPTGVAVTRTPTDAALPVAPEQERAAAPRQAASPPPPSGPIDAAPLRPQEAQPAPLRQQAVRPVPPRLQDVRPAPNPPRASTPAQPVLPFDAVLGTILYGADRKLAIVDGAIVGEGDTLRGATIVEITPSAVMLRDAQGRMRRLTLGSVSR